MRTGEGDACDKFVLSIASMERSESYFTLLNLYKEHLKYEHALKHQGAQAWYLRADTMEHQGTVKVRTKRIREIGVIKLL